jgi:hypothetical protein
MNARWARHGRPPGMQKGCPKAPLTSGNVGSERRESNPRSQLGKLMYCLCTTLARKADLGANVSAGPTGTATARVASHFDTVTLQKTTNSGGAPVINASEPPEPDIGTTAKTVPATKRGPATWQQRG